MPKPLKPQIHQACIAMLEARISRLQQSIVHAQQAASDDTKSSAGDKFETSREMMKLEIDKNNAQLSQADTMLQHLHKLNPGTTMDKVAFGSLVHTNEGIYYFSVGLGKLMVDDKVCFALSMVSPIGKALGGRKAGETVDFMGRKVEIEAID
jgi:transcription elongation GreA/GreB family factor